MSRDVYREVVPIGGEDRVPVVDLDYVVAAREPGEPLDEATGLAIRLHDFRNSILHITGPFTSEDMEWQGSLGEEDLRLELPSKRGNYPVSRVIPPETEIALADVSKDRFRPRPSMSLNSRSIRVFGGHDMLSDRQAFLKLVRDGSDLYVALRGGLTGDLAFRGLRRAVYCDAPPEASETYDELTALREEVAELRALADAANISMTLPSEIVEAHNTARLPLNFSQGLSEEETHVILNGYRKLWAKILHVDAQGAQGAPDQARSQEMKAVNDAIDRIRNHIMGRNR